MRYHDITKEDMLNGDGLRVVLWVSGCNHHCKGCHNPITWDENGGLIFDDKAEAELFEALSKPYIDGITFSGGDPLFPANREDVFALIKKIRAHFPEKTIWLYTGYEWDEIKDLELVHNLDVLVEGKFVESLKNSNLQWVGSSNQKVINIKNTIKENQLVLH